MGRRGRRRALKFRLKKESLLSTSAVLCLLLSALTFLSFFAQAAAINAFWQQILNRFFGWGVIFVPFLLGLLGLVLLRIIKLPFLELRVVLGLFLFTLSFLGLSHLFFGGPSPYEKALMGEGGGILGYTLAALLKKAISPAGAFLVLFSGLVVSFLVIFNTSLDQVILLLGKILKGGKEFSENYIFRNLFALFGKEKSKKEEVEEEAEEKVEEKKEPEFEIIPSLAEPLGLKKERPKLPLAEETVVNLPFSDQVWEYPPLDLLSDIPPRSVERGDVKRNAQIIEKTLESFGVRAKVVEVNMGPAVTQYALDAAEGTKIARITNLQNDLAMALASPTGSVRIEAPIPGKSLLGIEVPNYSLNPVSLKSVLTSERMQSARSKLTIILGKDVAGQAIIDDIGRMPHVLIAGATGSGKSILIHSFVSTLLFRSTPLEVKFILVDPKRVELPQYNGIPHLLTPVIVEPEKALPSLRWAISEMERRYRLFESTKARNINAYNELSGFQALPYILIIVDELADLMVMAPVEVEKSICRLAQMSRATGIHLILATQRPSVDVLTGLIKANIPCRVAFATVSQVDSRVIIDQPGAEKLLGRGDMLYVPPDVSKPMRIQGVFVSDKELSRLIDFLRKSPIKPEYKEEVTEFIPPKKKGKPQDELFSEAVKVICTHKRASASLLQRRLSIGYARAARLLDELEERGIVSPQKGSKPRDVLIRDPKQALSEIEP